MRRVKSAFVQVLNSYCFFGFLQVNTKIFQACCNPVYSGTHKFLSKYFCHFNVEYTWVPSGSGVEAYRKAIKPNTKVN